MLYRIFAIVAGFCGILLFFFVPETFWDRAPVPRKSKSKSRPNIFRRLSSRQDALHAVPLPSARPSADLTKEATIAPTTPLTPGAQAKAHRVAFATNVDESDGKGDTTTDSSTGKVDDKEAATNKETEPENRVSFAIDVTTPQDYFSETAPRAPSPVAAPPPAEPAAPAAPVPNITPASRSPSPRGAFHDTTDSESQSIRSIRGGAPLPYTAALRDQPARSFAQSLKPFNGRLNKDKWHKVAIRPLILFTYPAVLWSSVVYACSVGWLIVISESVAVIYREDIYQFDALQTGLVYISPFVGGILGSAVAGRVSDVIVKAMARRNGGLYEPEFRLVMAIPIALTTVIGLMGFGWSAQVHDHYMVPTVFFGIISFGCTMGSTTSITFCVDSYRQYAGEALVTLNFSKNVLHGLVFSLFVTGWLSNDGPKTVYIWIGIIQLILLLFTIPLYIFGKRLRMWTVRRNFMERF